jgi:hypothetical protein
MMPDCYGDVYAPVTWGRSADHDYKDKRIPDASRFPRRP